MIEKNRLLGLEIIRFLSASLVLFLHYHHFCNIGIRYPVSVSSYPFYYTTPFLYAMAEWAVRIFWCISGFIFFWKYQSLIAQKTVGFKDFFISRFARLYPLHLLTLLLVAFGQAIYRHITGFYFVNYNCSTHYFILQLFMASNRVFNNDSFNWPVWSVSLELVVYILFFLLTRFITTSIRMNMFIVVSVFIASYLIPQFKFIDLLHCMLFFYIGGAAALIKKYSLQRGFTGHFVWLAVILAPIIFWNYGQPLSVHTAFVFWTIWLALLLYCASYDFKVNTWTRRSIEILGNMTYSSYLLHFPVQILCAIICFHWKILLPTYNPIFLAAYFSLIFFLSYFVYKFFEMPMREKIKSSEGWLGLKPHHLVLLVFAALACLLPYILRDFALKKTETLDPSTSGYYFLHNGDYNNAIDEFNQAIKFYPYNPDDYANLGYIYFTQGNDDLALPNLKRAIELNPNYILAYNVRSIIYYKQQHYDLGLKDIDKTIAMEPTDHMYYNRGVFYRDLGKYEDAMKDFKKALSLDSADLYFSMGLVYGRKGNMQEAINNFNKAITKNPDFAEAYKDRAMCYFHLNDYAHSWQDAQKAKKLGLNSDPELLRVLQNLQGINKGTLAL